MNQKTFGPHLTGKQLKKQIGALLKRPHKKIWHTFECPTRCGCAVRCVFVFSPDETTMYYDGPAEIISQCAEHAEHKTPQTLYDAIIQFRGHGLSSPCGCYVHHWAPADDERDEVKVPIHHSTLTRHCDEHKHLETDPHAHKAAVHEHMALLNQVLAPRPRRTRKTR